MVPPGESAYRKVVLPECTVAKPEAIHMSEKSPCRSCDLATQF